MNREFLNRLFPDLADERAQLERQAAAEEEAENARRKIKKLEKEGLWFPPSLIKQLILTPEPPLHLEQFNGNCHWTRPGVGMFSTLMFNFSYFDTSVW